MRSTISTIVALASSLQLASASWNNAPPFSCPANTNNQCNSQQTSGFDWSGLNFGSFSNYGSFDFNGFTCASSFGGGSKRDLLSGRGFQNTCITGSAQSDASKCPSFGCGSSSDVSAFSVSELQISVEFDCELEFHYSMPGGNTCKQTSSCSSGGSIVKNSQCGGAKSVTVVYPSQTAGSGKGKSSCSIGVHSIGFDCSSASSTKYHSTATSTPIKATSTSSVLQVKTTPSSSPAVATSSTSPAATTSSTSPTATTFSTYVQQTTSSASPAATTSSTNVPGTTTSSAQVVVSSPTTSGSVVEVITTVVVDTTTTLCPVTLTHTNANGTSIQVSTSTSTLLLTTTKTICTKCEAATSTTSPAASPVVSTSSAVGVATTATTVTTSSLPVTTATCPDVLPACLNTWLFIEGCVDNTDTDCFCPSSEFVSNVFSCLSAYGASDTEISSAQTYFQGICAPHIPSNPAIITCASSVTATTTQTYPVTTITVQTTLTVPCTETTGISSGFTIPSSYITTTISTQVTVPQVVFTTSSGGAVLITGAPTIGNAGVATATQPASTLAVATATNASTKPTTSPTTVFNGSGSKNGATIGASLFAVLFAALIL